MANFFARYSGLFGGGGGGGGVTSLNSETGDITLTSVDSSVTIVAAGQTIDLSAQKLALGNLTDAGTDGITVTGGTGAVIGSGTSLAQHVADTTHNGYLSSTDWNTFNGKQAALTIGNLTDAGTDGITVTSGTGAVIGSGTSIAQHVADTTHNGYLSSTDWNTFNSKQAALTIGNLTDAGTDGITVTSGTGAVVGSGTSIAQHVADTTHNGYLSSTDWNTFNGKQSSGNYLTALTGDGTAAGPGSSALTLATVNSNVGSFTAANITVNAKGLVTAAANGTPPLLPVGAKTSNYTLTTADGFVTGDATGGAFAFTLPTAVGNSGLVFQLKRIDSTLANAISITTTSAQTIDGYASNAITLATKYEDLAVVSNGTNWNILSHKTITPMVSYTPTGSWVSNTTYSGFWKRNGDCLEAQMGAAITGTPTSAQLTFSVPSGLVIDTAKLPTVNSNVVPIVGTAILFQHGTASFFAQPIVSTGAGPTTVNIRSDAGNTTQVTPFTFTNGDFVSVQIRVPIVGWIE